MTTINKLTRAAGVVFFSGLLILNLPVIVAAFLVEYPRLRREERNGTYEI